MIVVRGFTAHARRVVLGSGDQAMRLGAGGIGPEHLLLGMLAEPECLAGRVLAGFGVVAGDTVRELVDGVSESVRRAGLDDADAAALADLGIDLRAVVRQAEESFGPGALVPVRPAGRRRNRGRRHPFAGGGRIRRWRRWRGPVPLRPESRQVLARSIREARELGHHLVGTEHLLLAILAGRRGPAYDLLRSYGVDYATARSRTLELLRRAC
ncbi:MAG TPA: Clp protease N-terminal domain-containing protein [Mycobacteriales bacterium]|nr:Clp protease N-terminal domain-containing protein [Mycobacteriales bacterium]